MFFINKTNHDWKINSFCNTDMFLRFRDIEVGQNTVTIIHLKDYIFMCN